MQLTGRQRYRLQHTMVRIGTTHPTVNDLDYMLVLQVEEGKPFFNSQLGLTDFTDVSWRDAKIEDLSVSSILDNQYI
jgi:hypothetical protein